MAETANIKSSVGTVKSEKRYLSDRVDVQGARNKAFDANKDLILAVRAFGSVSRNDSGYAAAAAAVAEAQRKLDEAKAEVVRVEGIAKADYKKAYSGIEKKKSAKETDSLNRQIEAARSVRQRLVDSGQPVLDQDAVIEDLIARRDKTGKYAPKPGDAGSTADQGGAAGAIRDYEKQFNDAAKYIDSRTAQGRLELQKSLRDAKFYNGPINGLYSDELVDAYRAAIAGNKRRSTELEREIPFFEYLVARSAEVAGTGDGERKTTGSIAFSTKLEAQSRVERLFESELGRLPTKAELEKYTKRLQKEERKPTSIEKYVPKDIGGGVIITQSVGGLDRDQFITNQIRKLPEYSERKTAARSLNLQDLQKTAAANGIKLDTIFGKSTVDSWLKRAEAGEDIDIFKNIIRKQAGTAMPQRIIEMLDNGVDLESIYAPYRKTMAATLEIPENAITLDDQTLRRAIGPDASMNIFDFQRSLRKDPRWQYTDNARQEVSSAALGILRDFGFQG